jgi:NADP-dependent 3-hydroxy acid dehydrogenase YdfG
MSNNIEPKVVVITGASVAMGARHADRLQSLAKGTEQQRR